MGSDTGWTESDVSPRKQKKQRPYWFSEAEKQAEGCQLVMVGNRRKRSYFSYKQPGA